MKHERGDTNCLLFLRTEFTSFPLSALLQEIKVLVVAHNIPSRQFPKWDVAVVTSPVTHSEDSMQSQSIEEVVTECLTLLVNVADYVLKSAEDDSKANSDSLCVLPPELLIPAATIGYLSKAEECASPVDFLRMYLSPVQPALDSEVVWPIPLHLSA